MSLTLQNCEKMSDKETRVKAWALFRGNKVLKITNVDINEHIGSLYEAVIKVGKTTHTLCFAITKTNDIILGKCFCGFAEGILCQHYLAVLLCMKYQKQVEMSQNIYCPVKVLFAGSGRDFDSVNKTADAVFNRYLRKGKITDWYLPYAIEAVIYVCMCAEDDTVNFTKRFDLYCLALKKLDKLFTYASIPYSPLLIEHAKGVIQLIERMLKINLPNLSLIVVKPCYEKMYKTSGEINNWLLKYNVWESLLIFCDTQSIRIDYADKLKTKIYNQKNEKKKSDIKILYLLLLRSYNSRLAGKYLYKNIDDDAFRKLSVDLHIAAQQFDEAINLTNEGLIKDKGDIEHCIIWWKTLFKIYSKLLDLKKMKYYAKKLILQGDFDYYLIYKRLFENAKWHKERDKVLEKIKDKGMEEFYLQLILEENLQERLYDYVSQHPIKILTLYPYFDKNYYCKLSDLLQNSRNQIKDKGDAKMVNLVIKKLSILA